MASTIASSIPQAVWNAWQARAGLQRLINALASDGGAVRYVGGAVRDSLLGQTAQDIDLATPLAPEAVIERLQAAKIKVVPTGLAHGTVTAVCGGYNYEITSLRTDIATDGRHAKVAFSGDWRADAARRDFTINALYADPQTATISDYHQGIADLRAGCVRFIGDPDQRIAEDYLRILRYYRFRGRFGEGQVDSASHAAAVAARANLAKLSQERVSSEFFGILAQSDPRSILAQMEEDGILALILSEKAESWQRSLDRLILGEQAVAELLSHERPLNSPMQSAIALRRLAALLPASPEVTPDTAHSIAETSGRRMRLSNRAIERLAILAARRPTDIESVPRQLAYWNGIDNSRDRLLLSARADHHAALTSALRSLADWQVPRFPLRGADIIAKGIRPSPRVAHLLTTIETQWVAEDFPPVERAQTLLKQAIAKAKSKAR